MRIIKIIISLIIIFLCILASGASAYSQVVKVVGKTAKTAAKAGAKGSRKAMVKSLASVAKSKMSHSVPKKFISKVPKSEVKYYAKNIGKTEAKRVFSKSIVNSAKEGSEHILAKSTGNTVGNVLEKKTLKTSTQKLSQHTHLNPSYVKTKDAIKEVADKVKSDKPLPIYTHTIGNGSKKVGKEEIKDIEKHIYYNKANGSSKINKGVKLRTSNYENRLTGKAASKKYNEITKNDKDLQNLLKEAGQNEENLVVETSKDGWTRVSYNGETSKWTSMEISPDKKTIKANGGSLIDKKHPKGGPQNEFLNHPLPNKTYIVDESTVYKTNSNGLVVDVESDVTKAYQTHGTGIETRGGRPDYNRTKKENNGNLKLDDGGHAIGKSLGGCNESINITPQLKTINRGGNWKKLEKDMLEAAQNGKKVEFKMKIEYAQGSRRPDKYVVNVKIDGNPYTINGESTLLFDNAIK